jgi:hypothetical protein
MPTRFADGYDPLAVKAMEEAFNKVCDALGLKRTKDRLTENLAKMIVEQAGVTGEYDPDRLCARTLRALTNSAPSDLPPFSR